MAAIKPRAAALALVIAPLARTTAMLLTCL